MLAPNNPAAVCSAAALGGEHSVAACKKEAAPPMLTSMPPFVYSLSVPTFHRPAQEEVAASLVHSPQAVRYHSHWRRLPHVSKSVGLLPRSTDAVPHAQSLTGTLVLLTRHQGLVYNLTNSAELAELYTGSPSLSDGFHIGAQCVRGCLPLL